MRSTSPPQTPRAARAFAFAFALAAAMACAGIAGCASSNGDAPPPDAACADAGCNPADAGTGADVSPSLDAAAPARVCDVKAFGAIGDARTKDTRAIQDAIDACASTGGGIVSLHDGRFLSGMITLRSNITLDLSPSATLLGSQNIADYPDTAPPFQNSQLSNCRKALVYAEGVKNLRIQGGGTIDGNARGVPAWNGNAIKEALRPMAIFVAGGTDVTFEGFTVKDAATWAVVSMEVDHQIVRGLTVDTNLGPTHDGIDIVDGHDVLVENCTVTSGDDSICLKSGSQKGTADVLVRKSSTKQSGVANGVKFGTASVGSFKNIVVEDVSIANAQAAAMAVESVDGAVITNVKFRRITTENVGTPFFVLLGSRDRDPTRVGRIDGLAFEDIRGRNMRYAWGSIVTGTKIGATTFGISNISFKNIDMVFKGAGTPANPPPFTDESFPEYQGPIPGQPGRFYNAYPDAKFIAGTDGRENIAYHAPGWALFLRHATNVTFENCKATVAGADPRPWLDTKNTAAVVGTCGP